jgi:hypothetical protein
MHIITNGGIDSSDLTPEEQVVYDQKKSEQSDQLKANQKKASQYYSAIETLDPFISKIKTHKKIETLFDDLQDDLVELD